MKAAKADILLDEIARREGIEALDAEVDAEVARLAERIEQVAGGSCARRWRRKAISRALARAHPRGEDP